MTIVLVGDPNDHELVPATNAAAIVVAHGFREIHQRAIVRFLAG